MVQAHSSGKRKELLKDIQLRAKITTPVMLLLDMVVRWSSTYVMIQRAERLKEVHDESSIYHP